MARMEGAAHEAAVGLEGVLGLVGVEVAPVEVPRAQGSGMGAPAFDVKPAVIQEGGRIGGKERVSWKG